MTNTELKPPFTNIETLLRLTNYEILIYDGSATFERFQVIYDKLHNFENCTQKKINIHKFTTINSKYGIFKFSYF